MYNCVHTKISKCPKQLPNITKLHYSAYREGKRGQLNFSYGSNKAFVILFLIHLELTVRTDHSISVDVKETPLKRIRTTLVSALSVMFGSCFGHFDIFV
jgi:hypothetical protein